ncbi:hypothetical protein [Pseudomonas sp. 28 E 9]|nr:hypothetical protein [Pseudomonas sp. 28 E 9]
MRGEHVTVEFDGGEVAALVVVEGDAVIVRQAQIFQLTAGIVAIAQGAPALMFSSETVLFVVLVGQRPLAVFDAEEVALAVVDVVDRVAIGQGFSYKTTGMIALVTGNKLTAIVAVFCLFQQVAVEVVGVGGALAVEAGFLSDQAVGVVVQLIGFANFVFDFS